MEYDPTAEAIGAGLGLAINCMILAVVLAIWAGILYLLFTIYNRIPAEHRKFESFMIWLLIIPFVNLVINFLVFPKLADSFKSYFDSVGVTDVGDCGRQFAMYFCIAAVLSIVPFLNCLAGPVGLVLLILVLVKFNELKNRIPAA